jgi:hypothetical protein
MQNKGVPDKQAEGGVGGVHAAERQSRLVLLGAMEMRFAWARIG